MDSSLYLDQIISSRNSAIECRNADEVLALSEMVESLYPGNKDHIELYAGMVGRGRYKEGICIRLDKFGKNNLERGHSNRSFYMEKEKVIIPFSEIVGCSQMHDLGELEVVEHNVFELLFA